MKDLTPKLFTRSCCPPLARHCTGRHGTRRRKLHHGGVAEAQPCPLCIAQRTLFMLMGVAALVAFFTHRNLAGRIAGGLTRADGAVGRGRGGLSGMAAAPACEHFFLRRRDQFRRGHRVLAGSAGSGSVRCARRVQDTSLLIFGYSLAVWALVAFAACAVLGL